MDNNKKLLLENYRDKCFITNLLCQLSYERYTRIKSLISIPLILSTSVMTLLNSSDINPADMKIANIVLNGTTVFILGIVNNFKLDERISNFRSLSSKYIKLCHEIDDIISNNIEISHNKISDIIKEYDYFNEQLDFTFPTNIKKTVVKAYNGKKTLPNVLNTIDNNVIINSNDIKINIKDDYIIPLEYSNNSNISYYNC